IAQVDGTPDRCLGNGFGRPGAVWNIDLWIRPVFDRSIGHALAGYWRNLRVRRHYLISLHMPQALLSLARSPQGPEDCTEMVVRGALAPAGLRPPGAPQWTRQPRVR